MNRARARIKVLIDKIGMDAFREQVEEELKGDWVGRARLRPHRPPVHPRRGGERARRDGTAYASPNGDLSEFERFRQDNVQPQRQEGFSTVEIKVYRGDLTPEQFRGLAQIMRDYSGGYARTTVQQNLVLRWVRDEAVYEVWNALKELGLGDAGPRTIIDTVSCPGTDSCKLGITSSMGLNAAARGAAQVDAARRRADEADPREDVRLPQRLRPAPHREHRLHRRLDQGRRQDDPGVHPADRRPPRERRGGLRHAAEVAAALQARARRGGALGALLRGRARGGRGLHGLRRARGPGAASRSW